MSAKRSAAIGVLVLALIAAACARTAAPPAPIPQPNLSPFATVSEAKFVAGVSADLRKRYPSPQSAIDAGYFQYTAEDDAGIITYTNLRWFADDPKHPTQLWYDAKGRLIGTDFTMPVWDRTKRPVVWGLQPERWVHFIAHVHYVVRGADGQERYGSLFNAVFQKNGGDPAHPSAQPLVHAGIAKQAGDVRHVFLLPEIWITSLWVIPNPRGAFADTNPNVTPAKSRHQNAHPVNPM